MNNSSMFLMLDLIALACGAYCFYTWFRLATGKKLFKNGLLIPKELSPEDCLDEEGYIQYISPRLFVLAIVTTLYGLMQVLQSASVIDLPFLHGATSLIPLGVVMAVLVWFAICNRRANQDFFGM